MSYRLIDANAIASQRPEVNDMPCVYADLPSGLDGGHYDMRESDELQRENEKLRELVLTLYMCSEFLCGRCKHERGNTCDFDAENELRELGVEVDG